MGASPSTRANGRRVRSAGADGLDLVHVVGPRRRPLVDLRRQTRTRAVGRLPGVGPAGRDGDRQVGIDVAGGAASVSARSLGHGVRVGERGTRTVAIDHGCVVAEIECRGLPPGRASQPEWPGRPVGHDRARIVDRPPREEVDGRPIGRPDLGFGPVDRRLVAGPVEQRRFDALCVSATASTSTIAPAVRKHFRSSVPDRHGQPCRITTSRRWPGTRRNGGPSALWVTFGNVRTVAPGNSSMSAVSPAALEGVTRASPNTFAIR